MNFGFAIGFIVQFTWLTIWWGMELTKIRKALEKQNTLRGAIE